MMGFEVFVRGLAMTVRSWRAKKLDADSSEVTPEID